ncbi:hypothetical protein MHH33_02670 [Paenisporosarcina sp. FSL H8-0542]|uniref:hypothetical protein n=1 Tax=Paenisporosarcina sp. FSL H8-0542 TaxID=2921401 RepID=UPI00315A7ED4
MMKTNWLIGLLMTVLSILAIVFIIKGNINMAVLFMTAIFAITNGYRAMKLKESGFGKEAKWMKSVAILFVIAFFVTLLMMFL